MKEKEQIAKEAASRLDSVLTFWKTAAPDEKRGGFARITPDQQSSEEDDRTAVLHFRILWAFSAAASVQNDEKMTQIAHKAYRDRHKFQDETDGGYYKVCTADGAVVDDRKQLYTQCHAIYGLSKYSMSFECKEAAQEALELFELVELHAFDPLDSAYCDEMDSRWNPLHSNGKLRLNHHMHLMEAYTALYHATGSERVAKRLQAVIKICEDHFMADNGAMIQGYGASWTNPALKESYGDDAEFAWMYLEAVEAVDKEHLSLARVKAATILRRVMDVALDVDHGGISDNNIATDGRTWWVQMEAVNGLQVACELIPDEKTKQAYEKCWNFVYRFFLDEQGHCLRKTDRFGNLMMEPVQPSQQMCPYHTVRTLIRQMNGIK